MSSSISPPREMPNSPPSKRRKIPLACNGCRTRKARCDGALPSCSSCLKRKPPRPCVYEESTLKTQRHFKALENRLAELESTKISSPESLDGLFPEKDDILSRDTTTLGSRRSEELRTLKPALRDEELPESSILAPGPSLFEESEHLFGKTSTTSFMQSLERTILQSDEADAPLPSQEILKDANGTRNLNQRSGELGRNALMSSFSLPMRKQADYYLKCFWQYIHPVYPILHKPSFIASYQQIWMSEDERNPNHRSAANDRIFLSILSMVFALASQVIDTLDPNHNPSLTVRYYQQARNLFSINDFDSVSIPTVQLLLLTGVYLHVTQYTNRCWNVIGLAVRNAQSLGLHEEVRNRPQSQVNREMRRRIWYNCVILDSSVAMSFGRPQMIPLPVKVPPPLLIDDEYLSSSGEGQQPVNTTSYLGLFVSSIKLFDIMSEVVSVCNSQKETCAQNYQAGTQWWCAHPLNDILRLDKAMDDVKDQLPYNLRIQENISDGEVQNPVDSQWIQAQIMNCRFLYVRALLLRPLLLSAAQHRKDSPVVSRNPNEFQLGQNIALQICLNCVETVHKLIASIYNSLNVTYQSAGWVMRYTFAGAMVLLAARTCEFSDLECSTTSLQLSWSRCMIIFEHYREQVPSASRAVKLLEALHYRVASKQKSAESFEANNIVPSDMNGSIDQFPQNLALEWPYSFLDEFSDFEVLNMNMNNLFDGDQLRFSERIL